MAEDAARELPNLPLEDAVDALNAEGKTRESIRKSKTALAMIFDYAAIEPNPARSKRVKLPPEEPEEVEPPIADHVEAAAWMLAPSYVLGVLVLDATGARIGGRSLPRRREPATGPRGSRPRGIERSQAARAQLDEYVRDTASGGAAAEIERAKKLLDGGAITPAEYDSIKQKALGELRATE